MREHREITPVPPSPTSEPQPDASRRRFIVGGIVAAPLLVTLTAHPARANWQQAYVYGYGTTNLLGLQ
jgi:hypothetical protein